MNLVRHWVVIKVRKEGDQILKRRVIETMIPLM